MGRKIYLPIVLTIIALSATAALVWFVACVIRPLDDGALYRFSGWQTLFAGIFGAFGGLTAIGAVLLQLREQRISDSIRRDHERKSTAVILSSELQQVRNLAQAGIRKLRSRNPKDRLSDVDRTIFLPMPMISPAAIFNRLSLLDPKATFSVITAARMRDLLERILSGSAPPIGGIMDVLGKLDKLCADAIARLSVIGEITIDDLPEDAPPTT